MNAAVVLNLIASAARVIAAAAFLLSLIIWVTHWAVRNGKITAFNPWAKFVRGWSDPILRPVERRLVKAGGNPQEAALWLLGGSVVGGLLLIAAVDWLIRFFAELIVTANAGGRVLGAVVVQDVFSILIAALFIRVIGSWFGIGRRTRAMRIVFVLTDWLVEPLERVIPPLGMIDISPLVAYLVLYLAQRLVLQAFF